MVSDKLDRQAHIDGISIKSKIVAVLTYIFPQIGRTEKLNDTLNPKFQKQITVDYRFEEVQKLGFYVFDIDDDNNDVSKADFQGKCECTLGQVYIYISIVKS